MGPTMPIHPGALLTAIALAVLPGCQPSLPGPPTVEVEGLAPLLANAIQERRDEVMAHPASAAAWGRLGMVLDVHDIRFQAVQCYERAHQLDADEFRWPYFLGLLTSKSDLDASFSHFLKAARIRDDYAPLFIHIGRGHFENERFEEAARAFERAIQLDAGMHRARLGLAMVALARDEPVRAREILEHARARGAAAGEIHWLLAEAYRRLGDEAASHEHFQLAQPLRVLEPGADPIRETMVRNQGMTLEMIRKRCDHLIGSGQAAAAIEEWQRAARAQPGSADVLAHLGRAHALAGQLEAAVANLRKALELDSRHVDAQVLLADTYVQQDLGLAVAAYRRALELDPAHAKARFKLGSLLVATDAAEEGLDHLRQAHRALKKDLSAHRHFLLILKNAGRYREAVETYRLALEQFPGDAGLQRGMAWLLATCPDDRVRDGQEALAWARQAAEYAADPRTLETLAAAYAEAGDFQAAVRSATQAKELLLKEGAISAVGQLDQRLGLYRDRKPYREPRR